LGIFGLFFGVCFLPTFFFLWSLALGDAGAKALVGEATRVLPLACCFLFVYLFLFSYLFFRFFIFGNQ